VSTTEFQPKGFKREHVGGFQRNSPNLFVVPTEPEGPPRDGRPENELVEWAEAAFRIAKDYRDNALGMIDRWRTYRSWYLNAGGTWRGLGARSLTYVNMIYEKIEKLTADITEGRPAFLYSPHTPRDVPMTEVLNDVVPFIWGAQNLNQIYFHSIKAALMYGTWYWKVLHDPRFGRIGSVERVKEVPCWQIFPAPYANNLDDAPWIIEVSVRTVGELENDYGKRVPPEMAVRDDLFPRIEEDLTHYNPVGRVTGVTTGVDGPGTATGDIVQGIPDTFYAGKGTMQGLVLQKEMWVRDGTLSSQYWWDDKDGLGVGELRKTYGLKYPGGRVISWANGVLLYDRENPYRDGRFPYSKFVDISIPDFWYGMGEVESLINLQLLHDDTHEIIKQVHLYTALGRLIVDEGTGLSEDTMGNEVGEIWFVKPGTSDRVKWLPGSVPHGEFYNYISTLERSADLVTGSHDVTRGINPSGVTAGRALATLQNAAGIRIRARLNDIEAGLVQTGRLLASRVQQFWPADMAIRVAGRHKVQAIGDESFQFRDIFLSPEDREASFNVEVSATANIAQLRQAEFQNLLMMAQLGIPISPETLVETLDPLQKEKILADMAVLSAQRGVPPQVPSGPPQPQGAPQ